MLQQSELYEKCGLEEVSYDESSFQENPAFFTSKTRQAYLFTTENMGSYIEKCLLQSKKIACVAASGDFAFNAYLKGAESVDCFDITPVACFFSELKKAALQSLSYKEFLAFFGLRNEAHLPFFSFAVYQDIRLQLALQTKAFFDALITKEGLHPYLRKGGMIIDKITEPSFFKEVNPYLTSEIAYDKTQKALKNISFYPLSAEAFVAQCGEKYDLINLSNIFCYPPYKKNSRLMEGVIQKALRATNKGGTVVTLFFVQWHLIAEFAQVLKMRFKSYGYIIHHHAFPSMISKEYALFLLSVTHS